MTQEKKAGISGYGCAGNLLVFKIFFPDLLGAPSAEKSADL